VITPDQEQAAERVERRVRQQPSGSAAGQQAQQIRQTSQSPPSQRISQPKAQGY
jgi:hypothetical protein